MLRLFWTWYVELLLLLLDPCTLSTSFPSLFSLQLFVHNFVHGDLHPGNILVQDPSAEDPKLVLLDCGIATSLGQIDLENFHSVFTAIVRGEGAKVADLFLGVQQCPTVDEYRQAMADLVDTSIQKLNLKEVHNITLCVALLITKGVFVFHSDPGCNSLLQFI